jgi:nucleoid DNA-binding protein
MVSKELMTKNTILNLVAKRHPDIPQQVVKLAGEIIFETLHETLGKGKPVSLRGFGRLIPRHYRDRKKRKKFGLLFHPSPRLVSLVNKEKPLRKGEGSFLEQDEPASGE